MYLTERAVAIMFYNKLNLKKKKCVLFNGVGQRIVSHVFLSYSATMYLPVTDPSLSLKYCLQFDPSPHPSDPLTLFLTYSSSSLLLPCSLDSLLSPRYLFEETNPSCTITTYKFLLTLSS